LDGSNRLPPKLSPEQVRETAKFVKTLCLFLLIAIPIGIILIFVLCLYFSKPIPFAFLAIGASTWPIVLIEFNNQSKTKQSNG